MKLLRFQGYSDDTFMCQGPGISVDHDNCASGKPIYMRVQAGAEALIVSGHYAVGPAAGWQIGVAPADFPDNDDHPIPAWTIGLKRSEREYSPMLLIEAPDDVAVTLVDAKGKVIRDED